MKIKRPRPRTILIVVLVVIAAIGSLAYIYQKSGVSKAEPIMFQPEGQMLSQAIQPGVAAAAAMNATAASPAVAVSGYTYDSHVCEKAAASTTFACFSAYYTALVKDHGVDVAFADIKTRYDQNPGVASECHPLMHAIGRAAATLYPTVSEAYLHGDSFCWSGYYHGILEGVAAKIGSKNLPAQINTICADIPGKETYNFNYYNCVHGLGHGIMELNGDDVPKSLGICDGLTGTWEQESCYSGVFMENVIEDSLYHDSLYLKPDDLLYPCDALDTKYKSECYLGQTSYALEKVNYDFSKVAVLCATVEEPYRDVCDQSMGRDAANNVQHDAAGTEKLCAQGVTPGDTTNCVIGAAKEIISYYHSDAQAKAFCVILAAPDQNVCSTTAEEYYAHL